MPDADKRALQHIEARRHVRFILKFFGRKVRSGLTVEPIFQSKREKRAMPFVLMQFPCAFCRGNVHNAAQQCIPSRDLGGEFAILLKRGRLVYFHESLPVSTAASSAAAIPSTVCAERAWRRRSCGGSCRWVFRSAGSGGAAW